MSDRDGLTSDATPVVTPVGAGGGLRTPVDGQLVAAYDPSRLADGRHTVSVIQTDAAGNVPAEGTLAFTLDRRKATVPASFDFAATAAGFTVQGGRALMTAPDGTVTDLGTSSTPPPPGGSASRASSGTRKPAPTRCGATSRSMPAPPAPASLAA